MRLFRPFSLLLAMASVACGKPPLSSDAGPVAILDASGAADSGAIDASSVSPEPADAGTTPDTPDADRPEDAGDSQDASGLADAAGSADAGGKADAAASVDAGGDAATSLPSEPVAVPAPGGGGRNFYVGVTGTCPPPGYPPLNGGACLSSLGLVPWGTNGGGHARLAAGDTVYVSRDSSPYRMKFQVSGQGTSEQWIRVHGMLGTNGERPVIDGANATTAQWSEFYWQSTRPGYGIQSSGVVHVGPALGDALPPRYIEVANLEVRGQRQANTYTAENGDVVSYESFGGAIYARSPQHLLVRNCVLTDSNEGFYDWTGADLETPYQAVARDITLRGNVIHNVGEPGVERRHATYSEALGMVYEFNYFGPMTPGAIGNQLRDRSAGTIVRYNWIESPVDGARAYLLDLMEPEESANLLVADPLYAHDFVYGNVFVKRRGRGDWIDMAMIHWSENNAVTTGRTEIDGGALHVFHNTILVEADYQSDYHTPMLLNWAEQADCPATSRPALNDIRNNLIVLLPQSLGAAVPHWYWERCGDANLRLGVNWLSTNGGGLWESTAPAPLSGTVQTPPGQTLLIAGSGDPFVDQANADLRPAAQAATVLGAGEALHPDVTRNVWNMDFTPHFQIVKASVTGVVVEPRAHSGAGSDLGAMEQ